MRHRGAVAVCRRFAVETVLDLAAHMEALADPVAPRTLEDLAVPADQATSADPADRMTLDRGHPTPSVASVAPRGVMERRRGAGAHRHASAGADRSPLPAGYGIKGRSTIGASRSSRSGIRAKTVGVSTSSESGSRCKPT